MIATEPITAAIKPARPVSNRRKPAARKPAPPPPAPVRKRVFPLPGYENSILDMEAVLK